ncbi:MAG: tRNA (guanosine(37)-N1)-methyltransferase TrmD [Lachnospiraceae bacterium]|nr:tRNA (guanosine(37)-N1)-methyltransferase TrmD [Lachnospiraceae bacterium]
MKFHVLTLFPEMLEHGLHQSILGRAVEKGQLSFHMVNIRDYTQDKHGKVDDYPYGGGAGMLMQAQPVYDAYQSVIRENTDAAGSQMVKKLRTVYVTPQGRTFTQDMARELAREEELVFLCGHYEGIDERVLEEIVTDYVSIGDYVLTGGELPAMVMIDAIARLVPGVLHNEESAETESFHRHLLEYPQYSRPEVWHGRQVPEVLLSGNHRQIAAWRLEQSLARTGERRPDLYLQYQNEQKLIETLAKQKRKYIHMMELLARGRAHIVCQNDRNVLLQVEGSRHYALYAESPEAAELLLESPGGVEMLQQKQLSLTVCQERIRELLQRRYGFETERVCFQACYTRKEPLRVPCRKIRPLTEADLSYVASHCRGYEEAYLRRRLRAGALLGIFTGTEGLPTGFIGLHEDGDMGMLYVEREYQRQGLAVSLESWLINDQLKRGEIPYCQIAEENDAVVGLQKKLGLYLCQEPMWKLFLG